MSAPAIVTVIVVTWSAVLVFAVALCKAAAEGDRQLEQHRAGTEAACADHAPSKVVGSAVPLPTADPTDAWDTWIACTDDGPEGGVL